MAHPEGFEPPTFWLITPNALAPIELRVRTVRWEGFEPPTS